MLSYGIPIPITVPPTTVSPLQTPVCPPKPPFGWPCQAPVLVTVCQPLDGTLVTLLSCTLGIVTVVLIEGAEEQILAEAELHKFVDITNLLLGKIHNYTTCGIVPISFWDCSGRDNPD